MAITESAAWTRLGELLIQRRVQLDPRYRNRRLFAIERGLDSRLVADIERARRQNFEGVTLAAAIEAAYRLEPGSIGRTLHGGELEQAAPAVRALPAASPPEVRPRRRPAAPPGFVTDEIKEQARPYADEIWERLWMLAGNRAPDPTGDGQPPDPGGAALFGEGTHDQFAWDSAAPYRPLAKTWFLAVLRSRREAAGDQEQGTGAGLARAHPLKSG